MFPSRYLIRFDDICATMNWRVWAEIESCLRAHHVRPIVAIVPRNRDNKLVADITRRDFWERVREWQALGWSIGLHGYEHRMITNGGGLVGINPKSEFADLAYDAQFGRLQEAVRIFEQEGVRPDVWVAPWHSFDSQTLQALQKLGINCVSDGFGLRPWRDQFGLLWVPQQLWRFRRVPAGTWTVCSHHNLWSREDLDDFLRNIAKYASRIVSLNQVRRENYDDQTTANHWMGVLFQQTLLLRQKLNRKSPDPQAESNRYFD